MKNDLWEPVHDIFRKLDELFGRERSPSGPTPPDPMQEEAELVEADRPSAGRTLRYDDLLNARSELRKELGEVRARLADRLNERDAYLVLFAITAHFDELVQTRFLKGDKLSWPTLQRELFEVDDAGEIFYDTLDDILLKPQTLPFVLEVYYLCLNDGFKGRYERRPEKIREYMQQVRQRIPFEMPEQAPQEMPEPIVIETKRSPAVYYISAGVILLAVYWALRTAETFWNPLRDF